MPNQRLAAGRQQGASASFPCAMSVRRSSQDRKDVSVQLQSILSGHGSPGECRTVALLNDKPLEAAEVDMVAQFAQLERRLFLLQQQLFEYQRHLRLRFKLSTCDMPSSPERTSANRELPAHAASIVPSGEAAEHRNPLPSVNLLDGALSPRFNR